MLKNKKILFTVETGSFGKKFIQTIFGKNKPNKNFLSERFL